MQMIQEPSHYIFDVTRIADHMEHRFESLKKFQSENGFAMLVQEDFNSIRLYHQQDITKRLAELSSTLTSKLEQRIDIAEMEVSELTGKVLKQDRLLSVDDCREVFRTIENRKAALRTLAYQVVAKVQKLVG